jgi:predicted secreted protein
MADVGTGATFVFGTVAVPLTITSIEPSGLSRESIDVSDLATTGGRTFIPGDLYDPGEIAIEGLLDPDLGDALITKIAAVKETCTITFPIPAGGIGGATFAASGFVTELEFGVPMEEEMTFSMTVKLSDEITWTDST